jgi:hypothetical protein
MEQMKQMASKMMATGQMPAMPPGGMPGMPPPQRPVN